MGHQGMGVKGALYAAGSAPAEYIEHQRSPDKIIEALKEIYPADSSAIDCGYDVWRGYR